MNITVYLGANEGNDPSLRKAVRELGTWIGESGNRLVYGGSKSGLMGEIAESVLQAGGEVTGVEPQFFIDMEYQYDAITELIVTGHGRTQDENDRTGRCIYCLSRRNRNVGRNRGGDVQGVTEASGGTLHPL